MAQFSSQRFLKRLTHFCYEHLVFTSVVIAILTGFSFVGLKNLKLNTDLAELLPDRFESVQDLKTLEERFGGIGYVVVVAQNEKPDLLKKFADDIVPKLSKIEGIRFIDYKRPIHFLEEKALYFLSVEDLNEVKKRIKNRLDFEKRKNNPLYINLEEDTETTDLSFDDIFEKYKKNDTASWMNRQQREYILDEKKQMLAIMMKPESMAFSLSESQKIVERVESFLKTVDTAKYGKNLKLSLTGRYKKQLDRKVQIQSSLTIASLLSFVLLVLYLTFVFRSVIALLIVTIPLLIGLAWVMGMASFLFGTLNILTGFLGAILMGLGIDHGIHLMHGYLFSTDESNLRDKVIMTFSKIGNPMLVAALTTVAAFLSLSFSEFKAFYEFGILASVGMLIIVISNLVCMPALLKIAHTLHWTGLKNQQINYTPAFIKNFQRKSGIIFVVSSFAILFFTAWITQIRFNYDFMALENTQIDSFQLDQEINRILGYSQTPAIILTSSQKSEKLASDLLREQKNKLGELSTIDFVASVEDLIPKFQKEKFEIFQDIQKIIEKIPQDVLKPDQQTQLKEFETRLTSKPFDRNDLPAEMKRQFQGIRGNSDDGFVLIFPRVSLDDGKQVSQFASEIRNVKSQMIQAKSGSVAASGEFMLLADIIEMVKKEIFPVIIFCILGVLAILWLFLGFTHAISALMPALFTVTAMIGLSAFFEFELNYINIIMIPALLGIGVDGAVYLISAKKDSPENFSEIFYQKSQAITAALMTSAIGFGSLAVVTHPGLRSLGEFSIIGLCSNFFIVLIWYPSLLFISDNYLRVFIVRTKKLLLTKHFSNRV